MHSYVCLHCALGTELHALCEDTKSTEHHRNQQQQQECDMSEQESTNHHMYAYTRHDQHRPIMESHTEHQSLLDLQGVGLTLAVHHHDCP